jgi:hypothetical protein
MPDQAKSITELVTAARATLKSITQDPAASDADKRAAFETYEDLLLLIAGEAMKDYEGRTAALAGMIAELTAFTRGVKVKNPITAKLDTLTKLADKAVDLFQIEKKTAKEG